MCFLNYPILKPVSFILKNRLTSFCRINHLLSQMRTYRPFNAKLGLRHDTTMSNRTFLRIHILHVKVSFLYIIRNILQVTQESMLSKFLVFQPQEQGCSNLSRIRPDQANHTFLQLIIDKEVKFLTVFYLFHPKVHVESVPL